MTGIELPLKNKIVRNSIDFRSACGTTAYTNRQTCNLRKSGLIYVCGVIISMSKELNFKSRTWVMVVKHVYVQL